MNARNWHTADILAGLKKRGTSLAALSQCGVIVIHAGEYLKSSVA
jgi:lambda repressor-like predicted transcriptional regulator